MANYHFDQFITDKERKFKAVEIELVVFENESIAETQFNDFTEKANVNPTYLPKYDPDFWKGYNVIEPNQAIKDFKSIE